MGSRVNFYMLPEEEESFCRFITSDGDTSILYSMSVDNPVATAELPYAPASDLFCGGFALWNRRIADERLIRPKFKSKNIHAPTGVFVVHASVYAVIEMIRCSLLPSGLSPGRIWAEFDHPDLTVEKQREFRDWFRRLANWLNRLPYRSDMYRIGPKAKEYFDQGGMAIGYGVGDMTSVETSGDLAILRRKTSVKLLSPEIVRDDGRKDLTITSDPEDLDRSELG